MITEPVLLDTGPLVALLHASDAHHETCRRQVAELRGPVATTWAVLAEAAWLLRRVSGGLDRLLQLVAEGGVAVVHVPPEGVAWMRGVASRYETLAPQVADITLLYAAELLRTDLVFTLDRRDFAVYRTDSGGSFRLLPELVATAS